MTAAKPNRSLLLTMAIGAAVLAYAFGVFLPTQRSIGRLAAELRQTREYVARIQQRKIAESDLRQRLTAARQAVAEWRETAPSDTNVALLLAEVSRLAGATGIKLERVAPRPPVRLKTIQGHPTQIAFLGSFEQVWQFVAAIEQLPASIWLPEITVERTSDTGEVLRGEATFSIFADVAGKSG